MPSRGDGFAFSPVGRADGRARLGRLATPHGEVATPAFMPVGTQGTVKGLTPAEVRAGGAQILLANTYHLWLRPGPALVAAHGGLHGFMGWDGPILTDSGGFQVFSLEALRAIDDTGVRFRSHLDGAERLLTPEVAIGIQEALGSDIAMALDQCVPYPCPHAEAEGAVRRTLAWAERCLRARTRPDQWLFGIVQGGVHRALRAGCTTELVQMGFDGYALGSLSVGEPLAVMCAVLDDTAELLPAARPRYLMGVGSPDYLLEAVWRGIDLFDCVLPTRVARNGTALLLPAGLVPSETGQGAEADELPEGRQGRLVVRNAAYREDLRPLDPTCACPACQGHTRAYLRHLLHAGEMLGPRLLTLHNLHTLQRLMAAIRAAIAAGALTDFRAAFWAGAQPWSARNRAASAPW